MADEEARRETEVRRRLSALKMEMDRIRGSVKSALKYHRESSYFLPDLPTDVWDASSDALGRLVADYELIAELATLYGRVRDLRWRLRFKAELASNRSTRLIAAPVFDDMVDAIAEEIAKDLTKLLPAVDAQIKKPDVQPLGRVHRVSSSLTAQVAMHTSGR